MLHSIVGLSIDQIGTVINILSHTDNKDLATLYLLSLSVIDTTFMLILKEMFSSRTHILYWTELAKSSSWDIVFYKLNCRIFQKVFNNSTEAIPILHNRDVMLQHADILRSDFHELSIFLDKINNAAGHLKSIYIELINIGNILSKSFDNISYYNRSTIKHIAHSHIHQCLLLIYKTFQEYLPHSVGNDDIHIYNNGSIHSDNTMLSIGDLNLLLGSLENCVDSISTDNRNEVYCKQRPAYLTSHVYSYHYQYSTQS